MINLTVRDTVEDDDDNMVPAEDLLEQMEISMQAVTEAKNSLIMKYFAQLLAQLLDQHKSTGLKMQKSVKTPARADGNCSTRGILTTGQKSMFFALKNTCGLPVLLYFGTFTLNILPRQWRNASGLDYSLNAAGQVTAPDTGVDKDAVKQLLVAYIVFFQVGF